MAQKKWHVFMIRTLQFGLGILIVFALASSKIFSPVYNMITFALSPIQQHLFIVGHTVDRLFIQPEQYMTRTHMEQFQQRIQFLEQENARLQTMLKEANVLSQAITYIQEQYENRDFVISHIISKDIINDAIVVINKGKRDGLQIGYPVIVQNGILVGKIIDVQEYHATVMLLHHNQSHVAATLLNQKETTGIVSGQHNLSLAMEYVPKHIEVIPGNQVITSGIENHIPKGLAIGNVLEIQELSGNVFKQLYIEPLISYGNLSVVLVLKP